MMIRKIGMAAGILLSALFSHAASAAYQLNLTTGATKLSQEVYDLHNLRSEEHTSELQSH